MVHAWLSEYVALNPKVARTTLGALLIDPTPRRCPTPVGTDAWLRVLGRGGDEAFEAAFRWGRDARLARRGAGGGRSAGGRYRDGNASRSAARGWHRRRARALTTAVLSGTPGA